MMVQGLGHHGFASPRFTAQQYGGAGISHPVDHIKDLLHGLDSTNNNALARQVVLHSWNEMHDDEIYPKGSAEGWGCPTVSNNAMKVIDKKLQEADKPVLLWLFN